MLLTTSPCLSPLLLLSYVAEMPAGEAIQAHHRPTLLASAAPTHDATDAPCSRRYRCPRMGQNDDFIETLFFRWGVANNRVRYLFFVCGGWSRRFKKPGLKKMPPKNQLPLPRPLGYRRQRHRRQVAQRWAGARGWCRFRRPHPSVGWMPIQQALEKPFDKPLDIPIKLPIKILH